MKILQSILLIAFIAVVYASIEPINQAEESKDLLEHPREKRGLLLAKAGFIGGKLFAKKALLLGAGAGLVSGGLAGTIGSKFSGGGGGGCAGSHGCAPAPPPPPYHGGGRGCIHGGIHVTDVEEKIYPHPPPPPQPQTGPCGISYCPPFMARGCC